MTVTLVLPLGTSFDFEVSFSFFLSLGLVVELCLVSLPDDLRLWQLLVFGLEAESLTGVLGLVIGSSSFLDAALTLDSFVVLGVELSAELSLGLGLDFFAMQHFWHEDCLFLFKPRLQELCFFQSPFQVLYSILFVASS